MRLGGFMVLVSLLGLSAFILSPSIAAETPRDQEWPTFRGNWARTGYVDADLPSKLELLWEFPGKDDVIQSKSSPAVAYNKVYFTAENCEDYHLYIYALDAENGELIWSYRTNSHGGAGLHPVATVVNGKVYIGSWDNYFYCLNAENGERVWRFNTYDYNPRGLNGTDAAPIVVDNRVYIGSWNGYLHVLDANTGELIWEYSDGNGKMGHIMEAPAFSDGMIYFGTGAGWGGIKRDNLHYTGWVYAISAEDGSLVWDFRPFPEGYSDEIESSPAVVDNRVFIGVGYGGRPGDGMWAFDAKTGEVLWYFDTENVPAGSPAVAHDKVYFGANDGYLYALSAENGSVVWKHRVREHLSSNPPIVVGNRVILTRGLCVFDAETGELLSSHSIGAAANAPAFAYGRIYVATWDPGGIQAWGQMPAEVLHEEKPIWWMLILGAVSIIGAIILVWRKLAKT